MPKFMAVWWQRGGCDYTIGCGIDIRVFEAASFDEANKRVISDLSDLAEVPDEVASSITHIDIYALGEGPRTLTPSAWKSERLLKQEQAERARVEAKERAEYERLRNKFEK